MKGELSVRINVRREYVLEEYVPGIHVQIPSAHMERSAFISRHQDSCLPCHWCSLYLHAAETKRGRYLCGIKSFNTMSCSNAVFQHWHNPTIVLPLVHCPVDDTLFECSKSAQKSVVLSRMDSQLGDVLAERLMQSFVSLQDWTTVSQSVWHSAAKATH